MIAGKSEETFCHFWTAVIKAVIVIVTAMCMVQSSWHSHYESSLGSSGACSMSAGQPHPLDEASWLKPQMRLNWHRHLLLLSLKTDTHFTTLLRVEG